MKPLLITTPDGSVSVLACRLSPEAVDPIARMILIRGGVYSADRPVLLVAVRNGDAVGCIDPDSWDAMWRGSARWIDPSAMEDAHRWLMEHLEELPDGAELDPRDLNGAMWEAVA